jgi:membrane protease YdiL (CAAX protease family)
MATNVVPEPSTIFFVGTGFVSILGYGWPKRRQVRRQCRLGVHFPCFPLSASRPDKGLELGAPSVRCARESGSSFRLEVGAKRKGATNAHSRQSNHLLSPDKASVVNATVSAILQLALLGGVPFLGFLIYHRLRWKRTFREIAGLAGLQPGEPRYFFYSLAFALVGIAGAVLWSPPLEPITRRGSMLRDFVGLGSGLSAITTALLYGVVRTGFTEELLFRGLIAGSLARRYPLVWANLAQALIFLLPHLGILLIAPEMWGLLPFVFAVMLILGWVRIRSGSILGSWLIHASGNVTMALVVAVRTSA